MAVCGDGGEGDSGYNRAHMYTHTHTHIHTYVHVHIKVKTDLFKSRIVGHECIVCLEVCSIWNHWCRLFNMAHGYYSVLGYGKERV